MLHYGLFTIRKGDHRQFVWMKAALLLVCLLATPEPAWTQDSEDAIHHVDRLQTQRLNCAVLHGRDAAGGISVPDQRAYGRAQADYQRRLDTWRRRVAACEAGDYSACQ